MRKLKPLLAATVALVALAALTATAGAFRAEIRNGGAIRWPSLGKITFGTSPTIQCSLTLSGTLMTSGTLVAGTRIGAISEVRIEGCSGGTVEETLNKPWELVIKSVPSGLPDNVTGGIGLNIKRFAIEFETFGGFVECLYGEEGSRTAGGILELIDTGTNTYITGLFILDPSVQIRKQMGTFGCPAEIPLRGRFGLTPTQSVTVS